MRDVLERERCDTRDTRDGMLLAPNIREVVNNSEAEEKTPTRQQNIL